MLNQKKLAVAVAVALSGSLGAISIAQAGPISPSSLFFPHVVGSQTVASIVTVINTAGNRVAQFTNGNLHLTLWSKDAGNNTAVCQDNNQWVTTSFNDITTFDVYGEFGQDSKGILFETRVTTNRVDHSNDPSWSLGANEILPQRGFLLVDNEDNSSITDEGTLRGEAFIFEFAAGATWGYQAANRINDIPATGYDYSGAASADNSAIGIMPYDEFDTALMVTPVAPTLSPDRTQNRGDLTTSIRLSQKPYGVRGFFDRDENPFSRTSSTTVTCVGRVNVESLLFGANGATGQFLDGGWTTLEIDSLFKTTITGVAQTDSSSNAVVFKLEYNISDTLNGEPVNGVFNNATHILPAENGWVQ